MNVALLSFFRNAAGGQVQRYMTQAAGLRDAMAARGWHLRLISVYGDSQDATGDRLLVEAERHRLACTRVRRDHGGPVFGSTEHPARLAALSYVGNGGLEAILPQDDAVFYVESDLLWQPSTVLALLDELKPGLDVVAPLVFAGELFYDVFVFRKNGQRFSPFHPYHGELNLHGLTPVDSVGSAFVMRGDVGRSCRIRNNDVLLGFCADAWANGFTVNVDARQAVHHP